MRDGIWEICARGSVNKLGADWWAIGSGYQAALGYLWGSRAGFSEAPLEPSDAEQAIAFAATLNADVGDGCQVERLNQSTSDRATLTTEETP